MQAKSSSNIKMIDISHWQGDVNWSKIAAQGIHAAYAKSSEGTNNVDQKFAQNVKNAKAVGVQIGAYHFAHPEANNAIDEAKHFVYVLNQNPTDLMPCLDLESPTGSSTKVTGASLSKWARDFVNYVKQATGRQVLLYTGNWFVNQYGITGLADLPLWISNYSTSISAPPNCGGWSQWVAWQYTDKAQVDGVGACDMSVAVSLNALKGTTAPAPFVTMQVGSKGDNVKTLQTRLNALGFPTGTPDGGFGPKTAYGVNAFQIAHHLTVTGIVDKAVYDAIMAEPSYPTTKVQLNGLTFADGIIVNSEGDDHTFVLSTALDTFGTPHTYKNDCVVTINGADVQGVLYHGKVYVMWKYLASDLFVINFDGGYNIQQPYKLTENNVAIRKYASEAEALSAGWELFNAGHPDLIEVTPTGDIYTFGKHPDDNPVKPIPLVVEPTPAPVVEPIPAPVVETVPDPILDVPPVPLVPETPPVAHVSLPTQPTEQPSPVVDVPYYTGAQPATQTIPDVPYFTGAGSFQKSVEEAINALPEEQKIGLFNALVNGLKGLFHTGGNK